MNEWKPNAPELTKTFNRTPEPEPPRSVVSKAELDMLERQRQSRAPRLNLVMRGPVGTLSNLQANEALEARIKYIKERLGAHRDRAKAGLQLANF